MDDLDDWADEWELDLRASGVDNSPGGTVTVYRRSVCQFLTWLAEAHPEITTPSQIDYKHCQGWMRFLIDAGRAEATRRVRAIALRLFLGYVVREPDSGLDHNPASGLELPVPKLKPVPVVPDEDLTALLRSMAGTSFVDRRDTAIVRMLLDTGCRRAELVGINTGDLDLRHQQVMVHGKGGKDRIVPFSGKTTLALRKYLRARATRPAADSSPLFLSIRPSGAGSWRLTGGGVAEMIDRRCKDAGLEHRYPHQFRHTWAADLKSEGVHDDYLERLAGWSTPLMARRYGDAVADARARDTARRLARGDRV